MTRTYILFISFLLMAGSSSAAEANRPTGFQWDAVAVDVSSDLTCTDRNGHSESDILYTALQRVLAAADNDTPFMTYAKGRTLLTKAEMAKLSQADLFGLSNSLGDGTSTLNALGALCNATDAPKRILVLTNDKDNYNCMSPTTLSRILDSSGTTVDAIVVDIAADSVKIPNYDTYFPYPEKNGGVKLTSKATGGSAVRLTDRSKAAEIVDGILAKASKSDRNKKPKPHGYDPALTARHLSTLKAHEIHAAVVDTSATVSYKGLLFHGLDELRQAAAENPATRLGVLRLPLPGEKVTDEARWEETFYFAPTSDELILKADALAETAGKTGRCPLQNDTPLELLPIVVYEGGDTMRVCGLDVVPDFD